MMKYLNLAVFGSGLLLASSSFAQTGPNSPYYLGAGGTLWTLVGNSHVSANSVTGDEYNLAVDGDIRTTRQRTTGDGQQYDLGMNSTGTVYSGTWGGLYDGTTDGVRNYTVDWDTSRVLAYDRNWQNEQTLFTLSGGASGRHLGITYDGAGGLYISQWAGTFIEHYDMNGTLLGGFDTGFVNLTCLGMDYTTGTLWAGSQQHQGQFDEWTTAGAHLQTIGYGDMVVTNTLGGEFDFNGVVPEPTSVAVLGLGVLALLRRKRSK